MQQRVREFVKYSTPPRNIMRHLLILGLILTLFTGAAMAQNQSASGLRDQIMQIGNFVSLIIVGVAVPNGAYGFLEWMTAGASVEKDEQGRKRIRNTFIGLAGAAVVKGGTMVFANMMSLNPADAAGGGGG